ncbi:MAG: glutamate racemase [bacterium]
MEKVGFFDSGVGGLTVLEASRETISNLSYYYLGDTKHCPYGDRPLAEVRQFALNAVGFLREQDCSQIVMACNISSSIALKPARRQFPDLTIHGLINEDLVNHIKSVTDNGHVGVMATTGTVNSGFYPQQLEPAGLSVHQQACSPLVPMIEAGHHSGPLVRQTLEPLLSPLIKPTTKSTSLIPAGLWPIDSNSHFRIATVKNPPARLRLPVRRNHLKKPWNTISTGRMSQ